VRMSIPLLGGKYDALNFIMKAYNPQDLDNHRKVLEPKYNKGGALDSLKLDATKHLAAAAEHSNRKYMLRGCTSMRVYGRSIANAAERKLFR